MRPTLLVCFTLIVGGARALEAQAPSTSRLEGVSVGAGVDRFVYEGYAATAFTYRRSDLKPGRVGPELSVSLFPQALFARALLLAPDIGAAYNLSIPHSTLLIKAGISAITGLGPTFAFIPGVHLGTGIMLRLDDRTAIRVDAIRHIYVDGNQTEALWSIGFALASLPLPHP